VRVETYQSLDALPADAEPLFDAATTFFSSRAWWRAVLAHAVPPGAQPRLLLVRSNGDAAALLPMLLGPTNGAFRALTTPYTCLYEPLIASGGTDRAASFMAFARFCRSFPTTRLDALNQVTEADMRRGGRQAGLAVACFNHFGNWYENVANLDWASYLGCRPGALRETIRRRIRGAERLAGAGFKVFQGTDNLAAGIIAFETVYARSWKEPEPYPGFNPAQISAAGSIGVGRLGIWTMEGSPVAAQFWIVEHGRATVLKLSHDEAFKAHSPGTVLTAWMIRHMIEQEHVTELDFGRGDDAYKQLWVSNRRQMTGLVLINPHRPRGLVALAHHKLGRVRARLRLAGRACHDPVS
jgi:CelD/BcsL family acetyltransferase involved in cellulose biosynthesis